MAGVWNKSGGMWGTLCNHLQGPSEAKALILHAASSTTNAVKYCDLFESTVLPYWQSHPPRHRLTSKPYKSIWDKNSVLPEDSLTFKASHDVPNISIQV